MKHIVVVGVVCMVLGASGCGRSVEIVAHRGASYLAPENTLASVKLGWQKHADVEIDVYLTKDNHIVVIHDKTTKRTAGGVDLPVCDTDCEQLRALDVGSFKGAEFAGEKIPLLTEVIAAIPKKQRLFVEIKCGQEILPLLRQTIVESGKIDRIVIIGFDLDTVTASKKLIDVPTYWLRGTEKDKQKQWIPHDPKLVQTAKDHGLDGLDVHYAGVTEEFMQAVRASGQKLYVWTVDDPEEAARLVSLGVAGITTNRPEWLREQLKSGSKLAK